MKKEYVIIFILVLIILGLFYYSNTIHKINKTSDKIKTIDSVIIIKKEKIDTIKKEIITHTNIIKELEKQKEYVTKKPDKNISDLVNEFSKLKITNVKTDSIRFER